MIESLQKEYFRSLQMLSERGKWINKVFFLFLFLFLFGHVNVVTIKFWLNKNVTYFLLLKKFAQNV